MKPSLGTAAAVTATAVIGGLATGRQSAAGTAWYRALRKPAFQPPAVVFPIVWTALYAVIARGSASTIEALGEEALPYEVALGANLALNAGWTWTFFRARRPVPATVESAALMASTADLARRSRAVSPSAHVLLAPYLAWTGFATVLAGSIAWLNRSARR